MIADLGLTFATKDVSEDERVRLAHPELVGSSQYHGFVGGALSDHHVELAIDEVRKATSRGSLWQKLGASLIPPLEPNTIGASKSHTTNVVELGPQSASDSSFAARMRLHQSWYRARVLGVPCGTGPKPSSATYYGNMLTAADGAAGRNFLTPEIAQVARDRVAASRGAVEPFRLFHNMLSSQPMCFNLFGPLVNNHALATRLLAPLLPNEVAEVTRVAVEWAPEPAAEYLGDRTAFDAFVEYRRPDGQLCALGIETKLTESFSPKEYDGEMYRRWMRVPGGPWRTEADTQVHAIEHNQLWRDHLLAVALRYHPRSPYAQTRLMVVHHPADHGCAEVLTQYRSLLHDTDDSVLAMPLNRLMDVWATVIAEGPEAQWLSDFRLRYLDLHRSAGA